MRITIDNLDGLGPCDYTAQVCEGGAITVTRSMNQPSTCAVTVLAGGGSLALPVRRARVIVTAEDAGATVLFTGYIARDPALVFAGNATEGPVQRAEISAVSDEWLLDRSASGAAASPQFAVQLDGRQTVNQLAQRALAGSSVLTVDTTGTPARASGPYLADGASPWSANAGRAAGAAYAAYRAVAGEVLLQPAAAATLAVSDADGTFSPAAFAVGNLRELANDVTVTGEREPAAYISEVFCGDGATTEFLLRDVPFTPTLPTILFDNFTEAAFDPNLWTISDPGSHISISSRGLAVTGGTGIDGQTTLRFLDLVEIGGALVATANSVTLAAGSDGNLLGFYQLPLTQSTCLAAFRVRQQAGLGTVIVPMLNGVEVGTVFTVTTGHKYTLRIRLHTAEPNRVRQIYYAMVNGVVNNYGSLTGVPAAMDVAFDLLDEGAASNTPATILYDTASAGSVAVTPAACSFVPVNSRSFSMSIASLRLARPNTVLVTSTPPGGTPATRLGGLAGEANDYILSKSAGQTKLTFVAGRVPVANERINVQYRGQARAVARVQDPVSVAAEIAGGALGSCRWLGKILAPVSRSSEDCENAALAILAIASNPGETLRGRYTAVNPASDVWPGDLLQVQQAGVVTSFLVRSVVITDGGAAGEVRHYAIHFANDWGTEYEAGVGLKLSEAIAPDAVLPLAAETTPGLFAAGLPAVTITAISTTSVQLDMGTAAPSGGGFEIRRRDGDFSAANDGDLVARASVRTITLPRGAQVESFYIRAYDSSSPRLYSRFSALVTLHWPVS